MNAETKTGFVTIDEVRTLLGDTDPNTVTSTAMRKLLGDRGSYGTIDKFLNILRAELAAASAPPVAADAVPAIPAEAAQAIWVAAWTAAQVQSMRRTEKLAAERDAAVLRLETMGQDVAGLVATVDEQAGQLDQAAATVAKIQADHLADLDKAEADRAAATSVRSMVLQELERKAAELDQVKTDAAHAAELAEAGRDLMRQELARLTDQVGELKAALYKRAESVAVVPPAAQ